MATKDAKKLILHFINTDSGEIREKLETLHSKIDLEKLHMIWIKIPKNKALNKNEIRTFTLNYSPHHTKHSKSVLKMTIKKQPYPLYCTLFTPNEFDFAQTKYGTIEGNEVEQSHQQPSYVQKFKTYNSTLFRITSGHENSFEISYSFKPASTSAAPTKFGLYTLIVISSLILIFKYGIYLGNPPDTGIFAKQIEMGLFIIGGSLLLPQLTSNQSIRARYVIRYLIPVVMGILILI